MNQLIYRTTEFAVNPQIPLILILFIVHKKSEYQKRYSLKPKYNL